MNIKDTFVVSGSGLNPLIQVFNLNSRILLILMVVQVCLNPLIQVFNLNKIKNNDNNDVYIVGLNPLIQVFNLNMGRTNYDKSGNEITS